MPLLSPQDTGVLLALIRSARDKALQTTLTDFRAAFGCSLRFQAVLFAASVLEVLRILFYLSFCSLHFATKCNTADSACTRRPAKKTELRIDLSATSSSAKSQGQALCLPVLCVGCLARHAPHFQLLALRTLLILTSMPCGCSFNSVYFKQVLLKPRRSLVEKTFAVKLLIRKEAKVHAVWWLR